MGWLSLVIEEEGRRARLIASSDGDLIRPIDLSSSGQGGPLSALEKSVVNFIEKIRESEKERVNTRTLRPKDLNEEKRGPLGDAEARFVAALNEIRDSERMRLEQSRRRGGEIVRPIDVPGPLGEMERWYLELLTSEMILTCECHLDRFHFTIYFKVALSWKSSLRKRQTLETYYSHRSADASPLSSLS